MNLENNLVVYDGYCNLCNTSVAYLQKIDQQAKLKYIAFSDLKIKYPHLPENNLFDNPHSVLFFTNGKLYHRSTAVLKIAQLLPYPYKFLILGFIVPKFIRDWIYRWIAKNRHRLI